jgi:hypothetical protein
MKFTVKANGRYYATYALPRLMCLMLRIRPSVQEKLHCSNMVKVQSVVGKRNTPFSSVIFFTNKCW